MFGPFKFGAGNRPLSSSQPARPSPFQTFLDPQVALPMAAALMGNRGDQTNFANAFKVAGPGLHNQAKTRQKNQRKNQTLEYFKKVNPELAEAMAVGSLSGGDAMKIHFQHKGAQKPKGPTDTMRNLQWRAAQAGLKPGTPEYSSFMSSGGKTGVTVNLGKEQTEYDKALGKFQAERFIGFQTDAQAARRALNSLDVMESAMSQPGFYSGFGADQVSSLKRLGVGLGFANPEGISSMETFNAQAKSAALDVMGGSLGAGFSNADRDFVLHQVPNLQSTPEGNHALIGIQRKLNQRKLEIAQLARSYAEQNGGRLDAGFDQALAEWAEENKLFDPTDFAANTGMSGADVAPDGVDQSLWDVMTPEERALWN